MSIPKDNILTEHERIDVVPVNLSNAFNQGDLAVWDATNKVVKVITGPADGPNFVGIFGDTNPITSLNENKDTPYTTIITRAMVELFADDTATYFPGDLVTGSANDPQRVAKTGASAGNAIGAVAAENRFPVDPVTRVVSGIVGVVGVTKLKIVIKPQFTNLSTI